MPQITADISITPQGMSFMPNKFVNTDENGRKPLAVLDLVRVEITFRSTFHTFKRRKIKFRTSYCEVCVVYSLISVSWLCLDVRVIFFPQNGGRECAAALYIPQRRALTAS